MNIKFISLDVFAKRNTYIKILNLPVISRCDGQLLFDGGMQKNPFNFQLIRHARHKIWSFQYKPLPEEYPDLRDFRSL